MHGILAPWHAWRARALLQVESALEPLAQHLDRIDWSSEEKEEWGLEEVAALFGAFGPVALGTLEKRLMDRERREEVRTGTIECLKQIGAAMTPAPAAVA